MLRFRLVAGVFLAIGMLSLTPVAIQAHARYARSEPGADAVVPTPPAQLKVWFTEEVATQGSGLQVVDSAGNRVDAGDGHVDLNDPDRKLMWATLNPLADGVYTVNWVTISGEDGDQADGSFRFGVGASTVLPTSGSAPRQTESSLTVAAHVVQVGKE
jgi:methionine-rich copper-binding protein CopC